MTEIPRKVLYAQFKDSVIWNDMGNRIRQIIEQERQTLDALPDDAPDIQVKMQRLKVKHYNELWLKLEALVLNTINE